jgi:hypothetical protein
MFTRLGKLIRIKNTKTKSFTHENDSYHAVLVKTSTGAVRCLMFTDAELNKAEARADKNIEDQPIQSWISKLID